MKLLGLVVATLVLPLVPAAHAQEKAKEPKSVKLADLVGRWAGTWPNADNYTNGPTPTGGVPDTITIDSTANNSTGTGMANQDLGCGNGLCVSKPVVIGDTLALAAATASGKEQRFGYVIALKDQQLTLTNTTEETVVFIGKRIDVPNPKP